MRPISSRALAEFVGTFALVLVGCAATYMSDFPKAQYGIFGVAVIHGVMLAVAISATMGISGGNLNPAVTAGLAVIGRITPRDAAIYIGAQVAGGVVAALTVKTFFAPHVGYLVGFGTPMLGAGISVGHAIFVEAVMTFLLMSAVMGTCVSPVAPKVGGFGVGLALIPLIMVSAPLTGGVFNPARAFGPAIVNDLMGSQVVWWIGPILGAAVAALVWEKIILKE